MDSGANTKTFTKASTNLKTAFQHFVKNWRAHALMVQARADLRQADILANLAEASLVDAEELKARARQKKRRAAEIAPWIKSGDGK